MLDSPRLHVFVFADTTLDQLTEVAVALASADQAPIEARMVLAVRPLELSVNSGVFDCLAVDGERKRVAVVQEDGGLTISSDAPVEGTTLTTLESTVLTAIMRRDELGVFYRPALRYQRMKQAAAAYGLEHEADLERYFLPVLVEGRLVVQPRLPGLLSLHSVKQRSWEDPAEKLHRQQETLHPSSERIVVISRHKYYRHIRVDVMQAGRTKTGKVKPPFTRLQPLDLVSVAEDVAEAKFYAAIASIQQINEGEREASDLAALRTILKHGHKYPFYCHEDQLGETLSSKTLVAVDVSVVPRMVSLSVRASGPFYAITGIVTLDGCVYPLHELPLYFGYFLRVKDTLYLLDNTPLLGIVTLLKEQEGRLLIHASKYKEFRRELLDKLSATIRIEYADVKPGTPRQLAEGGFSDLPARLLYLSDFGNHVMIIPVVRYGEAEVAIRTERQLTAIDGKGRDFSVPRDADFELAFISLLIKQHRYLPEQLDNQLYYFYLHKKHFLDETWFLPAFDVWREEGIEVYGFNELTDNKLSPYRISIDIKVISGINWFNAIYDVRFGKKKASLKKIQAALRNKRKYVALGDGTMGILPQEWIDKFSTYFNAGEVVDDDTVRFAKANFEKVAALYDRAALDASVDAEIEELRKRVAGFDAMPEVPAPQGITVALRPYQQQGLNWLHFLDTFRFGGILADEMGLGKTVQIIAFMLSQREGGRLGTDLVVAPATLIFNWERELNTLAPSLRVLTRYGSNRVKDTASLDRYDVVLTSYTTLLSDIGFLKGFSFNYVYLDESQNIKNPESQRYKAVRLLHARNRIAISGTPFENSSFDLYGQLSFACPGLLGDKRYFRDVYAKPIDKFKNQPRRKELRQKIQPFILRRTKQQVAAELPGKVCQVLYSDMGDEQRKIYHAYEKEFRDFVCALSGDELDKSPMHVLRGLTRLRQICNSPALLPDGMLNTAVSAKIELLKEQVTDKAPHHKMVIFSQFVTMLQLVGEMLTEIGVSYVSLTGGTRQRGEVVRKFQEDPEVRVFLVSLKAGGTGLNLTAAEVVYLVDPWWNPAVEDQAIDRVHRIGQEKSVMAYRLVTPNTVEEKVLALQATKNILADGLLSEGSSFFRTLDRERLLTLL
ncbi:SNF2-related protein [Parapedobacter sp. 2B3]|uniref:DEAD/DEAH box helicase n=1 Tax=Parapedobacter sp. 2B3 TaxID=3342381 RepID=UPI0035B604B5